MRHHAAHLNLAWDTGDVGVGSDQIASWEKHLAVCRPVEMSRTFCVLVLNLMSSALCTLPGKALTHFFRDLFFVLLLVSGDSHSGQISNLNEDRIDIWNLFLTIGRKPPKLTFKAFGAFRARGYLCTDRVAFHDLQPAYLRDPNA